MSDVTWQLTEENVVLHADNCDKLIVNENI